jgi:type II secretory pathway component PulJ
MRTRNNGYTLVELVVSIALAVFAVTIILSGYTNLLKGIKLQVRRVDTVIEMVRTKKLISKALDSLETVTLFAKERIIFTQKGSDISHTLEFHDSAVVKDGREITGKLKSFTMNSSDKSSENNRVLIKWECLIRSGGWAGGAVIAGN